METQTYATHRLQRSPEIYVICAKIQRNLESYLSENFDINQTTVVEQRNSSDVVLTHYCMYVTVKQIKIFVDFFILLLTKPTKYCIHPKNERVRPLS